MTDIDPKKERLAERRVAGFFTLSAVGSVLAVVFYIIFPIVPGDLNSVRLNTLSLGAAMALALLAIGIGVVHWAKSLMYRLCSLVLEIKQNCRQSTLGLMY